MLEIYAPFILHSTTSFETEVPSAAQFWERVSKVLTDTPWLVCECEGLIAGYAYAGDHRSRVAYQWSKELSVYVHPDYYKRNIARALYQAVIDILKLQGYCNVLAGITMPNPGSLAFHKKFGFKSVGTYEKVGYKFGEWRDTHWLQLFIGDPKAAAPSLRPFAEVKNMHSFEKALQKAENRILNK